MKTLEEIKQLINNLLKEDNYQLYSLKFRNSILEVVIDSNHSIGLNDIVEVSNKISTLLDTNDFTNSAYTLDVCSLGAEKPINIDKLNNYIGEYVALHLSNPYKGENDLEGTILEIKEEILILSYRVKTRSLKASIPLKDIQKARLAIKF